MPSIILFYFILCISILKINSQRNLLEEGLSDDIIILHTNDIHCGMEDNIGYDGVMLYKKELKTKYKHVLLVDAGDHIQGGPIGLLSKGKDLIDIMNYMEYDVVTIGNHEFDYKVEQLIELNNTMNNGYICANFLFRNKSKIFQPYHIVKLEENLKIGFIGVVTPQAFTRTYLNNLVDKDGNLIYDFLTENNGKELYKKIQDYIDEIRQDKDVKYVIILSHLGYGGDVPEEFTSKGLLANIKGVDAIIDGHTHLEYNSTYKDKEGKAVYISQAGTKFKKVGKLTIKGDGNITSELIGEIPLFDDYNYFYIYTVNRNGIKRFVDNESYHFLENIKASHADELEQIVGYSNFDLLINNENGQIIFYEENFLGDLVTDAIRNLTKTEIAIINSAFIEDNIKRGNITYNNILNTLKYSSKIIIKEMKGKDILDALEFGVQSLPNKNWKFLQVSGIKFKVDETIKSPIITDKYENFVKIDGERRIYDVYLGEEKLDENRIYKIAIDDYIAYGGGGYSMINNYKVINDSILVDSEILKIFIENNLNGIIPDIYNSTQGRIIKKKKETNILNCSSFIKYFKDFSLISFALLL